MHRLFIAVDLPESVSGVFQALRREVRGIRWTPGHQLHLTLRFLGDATDEQRDILFEALTDVTGAPFSLRTGDLEVFPSVRKPRVLVVRLEPSPELETLQHSISRKVESLGFPAEDRGFKAHITIARFRSISPAAVRAYLESVYPEITDLPVNAFHLYESHLTPEGARHERLASFPLREHAHGTTG